MAFKSKQIQLSELSEFRNGKFLPTKERSTIGKYDVYGSNGIIAKSEKFLYDKPVIVIGRVGANCGTINSTKNPSWVTDNCIVSIPKSETDFNFLYYRLKILKLNNLAIGSAQPMLTQDILNSIEIISLTLPQQQKIGKTLYDLDIKIENLQTQNKILEQTAQTIFKSWFVDFDGVTEFEDSKLGQIPKGWEVESLDDNINFLNGLALQNFRPLNEEFLPAIKIKEMNEGISEKTEKVGLHIDPKYIINNGDVLFSWSGSLVLTLWCFGRGALNQHLFKVTSEKYTKWFFYQWTKFHLLEFRRIAAGKTTTMGHIQRHHLHEALILVPPIKILENYNTIFQPIFDQIISNKLEVENLTKTRDALLPKLMSGEIRV